MTRVDANDDRSLLDQQIAYYRERAAEYEEWFLRQGRYDRGPAHRAEWDREVAALAAAVESLAPLGDVLELACGTGWWTRRLAPLSARVLAVDSSPEVIAINRSRTPHANVDYTLVDIFSQPPIGTFDVVFFSFWLSHVPPARFDAFWRWVGTLLRPAGQVFFIDSLAEPSSTAVDQRISASSDTTLRRLNDGREFRIVKIFYEPADLQERLTRRGWIGDVRSTGKFFFYGAVRPTTEEAAYRT